jgi:hypothetical protein
VREKKVVIRFTQFFFSVTLFCFAVFPLGAQETRPGEAVSDYRLDENGRILQRLSWSRSNASFFEVEIERQAGPGLWEPVVKERTNEFYLELSLPSGQYRYRILSYNILDRVAATSEWVGIRVFVAKQPVVEALNPGAYYFDIPAELVEITILGSDLGEEAEVYLAAKTGDGQRMMPLSVSYSADEKSIRAVFPTADLALISYEIVVTNPGGLQTRADFTAAFSRKRDITVSLGYSPVLPLYGYVFDSFSKSLYPAGFYGRVGVVPFKWLWGFIGAELTPQFTLMKTEADTYTVTGNMLTFTLNGLYQRWFRAYTMAVNLRLGGGLTAITGIRYEHNDGPESEKVNVLLSFINTGVSFQWVVWRDLFVEAGAEYIQSFSSISPLPGFVRLNAGAGWKF